MHLSTLGTDGFPDGRMVLLKECDKRGFVFYTNLNSAKGRALKKTPRASLTFHWAPLKKQVRIQGKTDFVSDAEADAYWSTRPRSVSAGRLGVQAKRRPAFEPRDAHERRRQARAEIWKRSNSSSCLLDRRSHHPAQNRILAGPRQPPARPFSLYEERRSDGGSSGSTHNGYNPRMGEPEIFFMTLFPRGDSAFGRMKRVWRHGEIRCGSGSGKVICAGGGISQR